MNTTTTPPPISLPDDISALLGLAHLSEAERGQYLGNVEAMLLESAYTRLVAHLQPPDRERLAQLTSGYSGVSLLEATARIFPLFSLFFLEEVQAWRDEVRQQASVVNPLV